jgi:hypothetical protein
MNILTKLSPQKENNMKTRKSFLALAAISITLASTFLACSGDGFASFFSDDDKKSSSSAAKGDDGSDSQKDGGNCNDPSATVTIGSQTWLKCNLNVMHNSGRGNSWCYDNDSANCAIYGRI